MKTKLHYYKFDLSKTKDVQTYHKLRTKLKEKRLKLFDSISSSHNEFYTKQIKPLDNTFIELDTKFLFNNQWNTAPMETSENGLRVFDWAEAIYPNRNIKEGMYLDQTIEMDYIRSNTTKCGYCGAQYLNGQTFCDSCLDSEHLKEDELRLLRLLPISRSFSGKRAELTEDEKSRLLPEYIKRQTEGDNSRAVNKRKKQYADIHSEFNETTQCAIMKRDGFLWLMNNNINIDNCIFYNHTRRFCFGWRAPVARIVYNMLVEKLCEFPFDYDIKAVHKKGI